MKASLHSSWALGTMLAIGFITGVACNQAANKKASADNATTVLEKESAPVADVAKPPKVKRMGSVIGLKKDKKDYYNKLHANPWPEINAMLKKCNIQNYSIYECELDGKLYLFSYFEYVGNDLAKDMAVMAANPKVKQWWAETDPCQIVLPGTPKGEQWKSIEEVYHLD